VGRRKKEQHIEAGKAQAGICTWDFEKNLLFFYGSRTEATATVFPGGWLVGTGLEQQIFNFISAMRPFS